MTLKEWLEKERRSMDWAAKQLGYKGGATICNWVHQKSFPGIGAMLDIERLTEGYVLISDWVNAYEELRGKK